MAFGRTRRLMRRLWRAAIRAALLLAVAVVGLVVLFRWVNPPPGTLMVAEWMRLGHVERDWVPLAGMSEYLPLSAAAAEDADFCRHWGFDVAGIRAALADTERRRGGSTISQQVAKNVFLWPERSWLRKGLEAGFTGLIELALAEAADHGGLSQRRRDGRGRLRGAGGGAPLLGPRRRRARAAALGRLMAVLPDPKRRSPVSGSSYIARRGAAIESGATTIRADGRAACFL